MSRYTILNELQKYLEEIERHELETATEKVDWDDSTLDMILAAAF